MNTVFMKPLMQIVNLLNALGIVLILLMAFVFQFVFKELPCPLCLLQRAGFLITAIGFLLNLRFGLRPSHYALSLLGALFTAFVALRQIALHVLPGSGGYGLSIFGLHMYTWSFIISMAIVLFNTMILGVDTQYQKQKRHIVVIKPIMHAVFGLLLFLALTNCIAIVAECGLKECPDNPTAYLW